MIRALLDTNVIVSSTISEYGPSRRILEAWVADRFALIAPESQLAELGRVLGYERIRGRYGVDEERAGELLSLVIRKATILEDPLDAANVVDDTGDNILLAAAIESGADFLVTGDQALLNLHYYGSTAILAPRQFLEQLLKT